MPSSPSEPLPERLAPQLATVADAPPRGDEWLHEIKYDGYRIVCRVEDGRVRCFTRSGQDWAARLGPVAAACAALPAKTAWLDGEVVVFEDGGRTRFESLQEALSNRGAASMLRYVVFDLLHHDGADLRWVPLERRKHRLAALLRRGRDDTLVYGDHVVGRGDAFLRQACAHGLEGIVSKRRESRYRAGRGADWQKVRCGQRGEFVVGGFTDPSGTRTALGALLLGAYDAPGRLGYVGRVGTGFSEATLERVHRMLMARERDGSPFLPFADVPPGTHWVRPDLVAEVRFTNWTRDGRLRHPVFVGLREDKPAAEVGREVRLAAPARASRRRDGVAELEGVRLTNPDRVLWPEAGITKLELARYYVEIAEWVLPHVARRPLAVVRAPRGHTGTTFFQKHLARGMPDAIHGVTITGDDGPQRARLGRLGSRVWSGLVQMDVLEVHAWGSRVDRIERPDRLVLDLDPDEAVPWARVVEAARVARLRIEHLGLECGVKTTGGKGLHVVIPIARRLEWPAGQGVRARRGRRPGAAPARRVHGEPDQGRPPRQDLPRLPAQRSRRDGDRGVLDARAPRRDGLDAGRMGGTGRRHHDGRIHAAHGARAPGGVAGGPVGRRHGVEAGDHGGDAARGRRARLRHPCRGSS